MSKLKLSTPNVQSFCQLATNVNDIEVENNHNLTITDSTTHIDVINLTSGTINLHNSHVANGQHTNVVVGEIVH